MQSISIALNELISRE